MSDYEKLFRTIAQDRRYLGNLDWGEPRPGHPEGTIRAHIEELEDNLAAFRSRLSSTDYWKLKVLIHTHDTFKPQAEPAVAITDPRSHASVARDFLASYCDDVDLLNIVQCHDVPYSLWLQAQSKGAVNEARLSALLDRVADWNLFLIFSIIDGCTDGKNREPLVWFFGQLAGRVEASVTVGDML